MTDSPDAYQEIPYESRSYPQSHPASLAVIATLFGMQPRNPDGARVLEIGCAGGGNLLPIAASYPGSHFLGIDLSPRQIAEARAGVEALKLKNIEFKAMSLENFEAPPGSFDYIIAHGVYSWVTAPVRERLMALCSRLLAPMGVAYISFNTLPGSGTRAALREMVKFHTKHDSTIREQVRHARSFLTFMESVLRDREDAYARSMTEELAQMASGGDFYIAHEILEETNEPCYFHEFMSHAQRHGLQFLGEAEIRTMSNSAFPASVRADLREMCSSVEEAEQYADFVRDRAFRQTLLCRAAVPLKRGISPALVPQFHFASLLEPVDGAGGAGTGTVSNSHPDPNPGSHPGSGSNAAGQFRDADGLVIQVRDPLTSAALLELRAVWPQSLPFAGLLRKACVRAAVPADSRPAAATLANSLLKCYSASRGVEFHPHPQVFLTTVPDFPKASPVSRWQAGRHPLVTSRRHENVLLSPMESALLTELDGTRGLAALEAEFGDIRPILERFAQSALLIP
ncbi:MAG: class I SAM-dependent methyltransferase [Verrucomicrobiota bacterium]